jgi:hypothetical protein
MSNLVSLRTAPSRHHQPRARLVVIAGQIPVLWMSSRSGDSGGDQFPWTGLVNTSVSARNVVRLGLDDVEPFRMRNQDMTLSPLRQCLNAGVRARVHQQPQDIR